MTRARHTSRRLIGGLLGATAAAGVLFACTLTQSLDYLQKGDGGAGTVPDGDIPNIEGATDGGTNPVPVWQVGGQTKPGFLALDAISVYWIADGKVLSVPKATGGVPKLLGTVPPNSSALTADTDPTGFVFAAVGASVLRFPKDGSGAAAAVTVFAPDAGATMADTIGADDSSLFVLQFDPTGAGVDARILRMARDGGAQADISGDGGATTMTLDPASVIWLGADPGKLEFIQHAKAAPAEVNTGVFTLGPDDSVPAQSSQIAVDDTFLYWLSTDPASGKALIVSRKRQPAASAVTIYLGAPDDLLENLAVDDKYVYALETHASSLLRVPKGGGDRENLYTGLKQPTSLAVDGSGIYLSDAVAGGNGLLIKLGK